MEHHTTYVRVAPSYPVHIGAGLLDACGELIRRETAAKRVAVITDSTVAPLYLRRLTESLEGAGFAPVSYVFPAGEGSKHMGTLSDILEFLAKNELTRKDLLISLGGGVAGDMTGFAAGCYLRGVPFVQIPTTLLSAVDASVGGKTAVNLSAGKNLAGLFWQPLAVICDTDCFVTLPPSTLADGYAEVIKTAVLSGEALFSLIERKDAPIEDVVAGCVAYKAAVVERDEREAGERKLLNLGHTPAHSIERCSDFSVSHGRAVGIGLAMMTRYAEREGFCSAEVSLRIHRALLDKGLVTETDYEPKELARVALNDKKRQGDSMDIIVPYGIGDCRICRVPVTGLAEIFAKGM